MIPGKFLWFKGASVGENVGDSSPNKMILKLGSLFNLQIRRMRLMMMNYH